MPQRLTRPDGKLREIDTVAFPEDKLQLGDRPGEHLDECLQGFPLRLVEANTRRDLSNAGERDFQARAELDLAHKALYGVVRFDPQRATPGEHQVANLHPTGEVAGKLAALEVTTQVARDLLGNQVGRCLQPSGDVLPQVVLQVRADLEQVRF